MQLLYFKQSNRTIISMNVGCNFSLLNILSENSSLDSFRYYDVLPYSCCLFTELPEKPILLPPFVDSAHRLSYHLSRKGRSVTDRVVCVLGFACPDITYSPAVYPIAALLLHFMSGRKPLRYILVIQHKPCGFSMVIRNYLFAGILFRTQKSVVFKIFNVNSLLLG